MTGDPHRALAAGAIAMLGYYGDAVRAQPHGSALRIEAIGLVLLIAARHRRDGVPWATISAAVGFSVPTLRTWQSRHGPHAKLAANRAEDHLSTARIHLPPSPSYPEALVLFAMGHPEPGHNDFTKEAATLRQLLAAAGIDVHALPCVEVAELRDYLDAKRPLVLHLAAHGDTTGIALSLDGRPIFVSPSDIVASLALARHRPRLTVLNICDSAWAARGLATLIDSAIAWRGQVNDEQARTFAQQLYRRLARGATVGISLESAEIAVRARWPALSPVLHGSSATTLLVPHGIGTPQPSP